jgi:nitrogen fixation NifU-like protein
VSDLDELYQSVILEHDRNPRNFRAIEGERREAEGYNPLCGDRVKVMVRVEDGVVVDAAFQGSGCAISKASASLMTEAVRGKPVAEVEQMFAEFRDGMTGRNDPSTSLGAGSTTEGRTVLPPKLAVLGGVKRFPMRVKCATLAWHALHKALNTNEQ